MIVFALGFTVTKNGNAGGLWNMPHDSERLGSSTTVKPGTNGTKQWNVFNPKPAAHLRNIIVVLLRMQVDTWDSCGVSVRRTVPRLHCCKFDSLLEWHFGDIHVHCWLTPNHTKSTNVANMRMSKVALLRMELMRPGAIVQPRSGTKWRGRTK
jgi:hypothetical protein